MDHSPPRRVELIRHPGSASAGVVKRIDVEISNTADGALRLQFGLGVPRRTIMLSDIDSLEVTRTRFWDGWGVRRTRRGWLYNVSGYDALLVRRKDGRALLVGTDEPRKLKAALERALSAGNTR